MVFEVKSKQNFFFTLLSEFSFYNEDKSSHNINDQKFCLSIRMP